MVFISDTPVTAGLHNIGFFLLGERQVRARGLDNNTYPLSGLAGLGGIVLQAVILCHRHSLPT